VSPESFEFTLTVRGDVRLVGVVRGLCAHAAGYARLAEAAGAAFCERVTRAAEEAAAAHPDKPCRLVFDCHDGELRVTVAGHTLVQPLAA